MISRSELAEKQRAMIRQLFLVTTKKSNPSMIERAASLVAVANAVAISSFVGFTRDHPSLKDVSVKNWDWFVTVAMVFVALTDLHGLRLGPPAEDALCDVVTQAMDRWDPNGLRGFDDCKTFYEKVYDSTAESDREQPNFISSDAVGLWLSWNFLDRRPETDAEWQAARAVGVLSHGLEGFWEI